MHENSSQCCQTKEANNALDNTQKHEHNNDYTTDHQCKCSEGSPCICEGNCQCHGTDKNEDGVTSGSNSSHCEPGVANVDEDEDPERSHSHHHEHEGHDHHHHHGHEHNHHHEHEGHPHHHHEHEGHAHHHHHDHHHHEHEHHDHKGHDHPHEHDKNTKK